MLYVTFLVFIYLKTENLYLLNTFIQFTPHIPCSLPLVTHLFFFNEFVFEVLLTSNTMLVTVIYNVVLLYSYTFQNDHLMSSYDLYLLYSST